MRNLPALKHSLLLLLLLTTSLAWTQAVDPYNLYISPAGNDAAKGTSLQEAFATIPQAQKHIRDLKKTGQLNKPVTVYIKGGEYSITQPFVFTAEDSGTEQASIIYKNIDNEKVLISGGRRITGWKKYKNNVWMTKLPDVQKGEWSFRALYVNGELRQRARIPNQGFLRVKGFPDGGPEVHYHTDCGRFEFAKGDLNPQWTNLNDVEVIVYHFWTDSHLPIQSIDTKTNIVTFQHKAGKVFTDDFTKDGARYVVENVWEGLDAPGEWYLNKKDGMLYYFPMPGEDLRKAEVIAPVAPEFIRMEGKPLENKPVAHIHFEGIHFMYNNFELPPGNSNDNQGSASVPAAITLSGAEHCVFENCTIGNTVTFAFDLLNGSRHNQITYCRLSNLGAGGIRLNGGKDTDHPLLRTGYNTISDNTIGPYGEIFPSAVGVLLMNSHSNEVTHNEIHDGQYTGVSVGWVWGYKRSISNHNLISYNHIHHIGQKGLLSDMGGIYTLGVSPGTILRNNLIHDVHANHYGGWGIYNDEGSSHILVENNIVYNTKFSPYNIHFAKEITVRNNIFALGKLEQLSRSRVEPHTSVYFENNIVYWKEGELYSKNWQDKSYTFYANALREPEELTSTFQADYNLYFNPGLVADSVKYNGQTWQEWQKRGKDKHSLYSDPLFINADKFDFRLQPHSPAIRLGFRPIDMSMVGVRKQEANAAGKTGDQ